MVKYLLMGVAVSGATLLPGGMALWLARAQMQPTVPVQCPQNPVWMQGFSFQELVPLSPQQYRLARVNGDGVRVRNRAGFESDVAFTLSRNDPVTIIGEAWDAGCNQWMRVSTNRGDYWMHGDTLVANGAAQGEPPITETGPVGSGPQARVVDQCPEALWTEGYRIDELIPLAEQQYRAAVVHKNGTRLRNKAGFESAIINTLNAGDPLLVVGEAWDSGCNQWMQVQIDGQRLWVHGDLVRN